MGHKQEPESPVFKDTLSLGRRSSWEAADTGLILWRAHIGALLLFFVLPLGLIAGASRLLPANLRPWSYFLLWWLKPFFDRLILQVMGIRFFEPRAKLSRLFRGLPRALGRGLLGDLLWRRFSPLRGAMLPIRALEGLKGAQVRQRKKVLEKGGLGFCLLITILCLVLEGLLLVGELLGAFMLIQLFLPDYLSSLWELVSLSQGLSFIEGFIFAAYLGNYSVLESLYGCMGFGIYINSRIEIEGWDIELLFRNFLSKQG